jgi:hypothetical protein
MKMKIAPASRKKKPVGMKKKRKTPTMKISKESWTMTKMEKRSRHLPKSVGLQ